MFSFSWDAVDKNLITLSALAGVALAVSVTWRVQRWIRHASPSEARGTNTPVAKNAINKHVATGQSEASPVPTGKRHSSSHRHHHKHAKSLSPDGHVHDHDERKGTEQHNHPRTRSQSPHSGYAQLRHARSREDSSRMLPSRDAQDEPKSMNNARYESDFDTTKKKYSHSGLSGSRDLSHQSYARSSHSLDQNHTKHVSAEQFLESLQKCIDDYFAQHPEALTYWEDGIRHADGFAPPKPKPTDPPGRHYRDLALREAKLRKDAFENSKRAYKMGRKADARQLSDEGKLHDENAKRYNALAAQEIFTCYNPRYGSDRLSKCDLHGLHVEEATEYAKNHLISCQRMGVDKTMLIVGKGAHSHQGGARIKPAIIAMLSETGGVVAGVHEKNEGCIVVEFAVYHR